MKTRLLILGASLFATLVLSTQRLVAGPEPYTTSKEVAPPTITQSEPWQFTIAVPGWMAGLDGTIGVRGVNADIDVTFPDILHHLDMIFSARAEAHKAHLTWLHAALSGRLSNQPRGSLDFAAGTHYTNVYERLELHNDPAAIQRASEQFVNDIAADLRERLHQDSSNSEFLQILKSTIKENIISRIGDRLEDHERHPNIPIGPLGGRIRQKGANVVEDFIDLKLDALRARIDALHLRGEARRAAVARAVNAAKAHIAN